MILTYKIKHDRDLSVELHKARQVAQFAIEHKSLSSKDVKQFGLKSVIANQILRKYSRNSRAKKVKSVKLTVPAQGVKFNRQNRTITITSLELEYQFRNDF